jgi:N-carbamoyl-L-amino-acid hydrolase
MEEEGGRFGLPCLGSRLLTGAVDPDHVRRLHDVNGVSVAEAARRVGFDPSTMGPDPARLASIGTFVELHIEQGRLLRGVDAAAAVGVGSEIVAHGRWRFTITGQGNHAGTTALADRQDPMIPAAAAVLAARRVLSGFDGAVATIGRIAPVPGGTNVIASAVSLWLDVRHTDAAVTAAIVDAIAAEVRNEAAAEGCSVMVQRESMSDRVAFDPGLGLEISSRLDAPVIPTAAGHDAGILAPHVPTAMLFVRNPSGISHAPDEHADADDCAVGVQALADVLETLVT